MMKKKWMIAFVFLGIFMNILSGQTVTAVDNYILPESEYYYLSATDLEGMTAQELNYARNEIYARYGRKFNSSELTEYFSMQDWYVPLYSPDEFNEDLLNQYEKENVRVLLQEENKLVSGGYKLDQPGYSAAWSWTVEKDIASEISEKDIEAMLDGQVIELGSNFSLDLDADGIKEEISYTVYGETSNGWTTYTGEYQLGINGDEWVSGKGLTIYTSIYGMSLDGEKIILVVYDNGPSDDPYSKFFSYENGKLSCIGEIMACVSDMYVYDNIIYGQIRCRVVQTQNREARWELNENGKLEEIDDGIYKLIDFGSGIYGLEEPVYVADEIDGEQFYLMTPGQISILYTDAKDWVYIQYTNRIPEGAEIEGGWLDTSYMEYQDLNRVFSGLTWAD